MIIQSPRNPSMEKTELLTKSKARFRFFAPSGYIVLNADWFEWNRIGDHRLNGFVTSDRIVALKKLQTKGFACHHSDFLITEIKENESEIILSIYSKNEQQDKLFRFSSEREIQSIHLNNKAIEPGVSGKHYDLELDLETGDNILRIKY